jgi:hypothetical protein
MSAVPRALGVALAAAAWGCVVAGGAGDAAVEGDAGDGDIPTRPVLDGDAGDDGGDWLPGEPKWHETHDGPPPWPHILTCYGGCAAPHYDASACGGSTACCSGCIDGTWWYATEQRNFGCGAKLELRRGDRCVVVEVADNGPADWVESNAASGCGTDGRIIDTSPLVNDYFGGGCGWSECFMVDVRPVADDLATGICPSCPCDGPPPFPHITMAAECETVAGQERDLCTLGDSAGIFDLLAGQTTICRVTVTNDGTAVGLNVQVGITIEEPYLHAQRYDIYDNWTGHDCGAEWCLNDSNDNPANPPHDSPGETFILSINGLSPGESKRVEMTIAAGQGSIGAADHPDVRGWVRHIDDWYEKADFWNADFNNVGGNQTYNGGDLRVWAETDVVGDEVCGDEVDEDCDGALDNGCGADGDADADADADLDEGPMPDGSTPDADGPEPRDDDLGPGAMEGGCGCGAASGPGEGRLAAALALALVLRRRRATGGTEAR